MFIKDFMRITLNNNIKTNNFLFKFRTYILKNVATHKPLKTQSSTISPSKSAVLLKNYINVNKHHLMACFF